MSSPTPEDRAAILAARAAAAENRVKQAPPSQDAKLFGIEREKRQAFRRLVDPGIIRPNGHEQAVDSLKILSTLAENLLREPDNPKFQQFKPTNETIKKKIVERAGVLEYAIALGFRAEVRDFQPYYLFQQRHKEDLRIGAAILQEALDLHSQKLVRQVRGKKEEQAAHQAAVQNVHLAFIDDRKSKLQRDELERQHREARAATLAARRAAGGAAPEGDDEDSEDEMPGSHRRMPGSGHRLNAAGTPSEPDVDMPPSYEHAAGSPTN